MTLHRDTVSSERIVGTLFQLVPSPGFLVHGLAADDRVDLMEHPLLAGDEQAQSAFTRAATVGDVLLWADGIEDRAQRRCMLTFLMCRMLGRRLPEGSWLHDVGRTGGFRLGEDEILDEGGAHELRVRRVGTLSAEDSPDGRMVFNVAVSTAMAFLNPMDLLSVRNGYPGGDSKEGFERMLKWGGGRRKFWLPVHDTVLRHNLVASGFREENLRKQVTRNGRSICFGEYLVESKRMAAQEWAVRIKAESEGRSVMDVGMVICSAYQKARALSYRLEQIRISASTGLVGVVKNARDSMPDSMIRAAEVCEAGGRATGEMLGDKSVSHALVVDALAGWFEPAPALTMKLTRFKALRANTAQSAARRPGGLRYSAPKDMTLVILYPECTDPQQEARREGFLSLWQGPSGKFSMFGFRFELMSYDESRIERNPQMLLRELRQRFGNGELGVVAVWRRYPLRDKLPFEFVLMGAGIPCQHVIDEGVGKGQKNANKMPALRQALNAKFAGCQSNDGTGTYFETLPGPYHAFVGLDVSRNNGLSYPSPAIAYTQWGMATAMQPRFDPDSKERRSVDEVASLLEEIGHKTRVMSGVRRVEILMIRDGFAVEDWDAISDRLEAKDMGLTVVSVRKHLLCAFGDDFPQGEPYAVQAGLSDDRFVFGVNAAIGKTARLNDVHLGEIIRNPLGISAAVMADIMIALCRKNVTLESGICSLPMPQHYADRASRDIRMLMESKGIRKMERTPSEKQAIDDAGGIEHHVFGTIGMQFGRHGGWALAV